MKKYLLIGLFLLSTVAGAAQVKLQWDANTETDLAGYKMYRSNVQGGPYARIGIQGLAITFTDAAVPDGNFYYVVTAYNTSGLESSYSNEVAVVIDTQAPLPPVIHPIPGAVLQVEVIY